MNIKGKERIFLCTRCKYTMTLSENWEGKVPDEDRCEADRKDAPGGYWYCSYEEMVMIPKKEYDLMKEKSKHV